MGPRGFAQPTASRSASKKVSQKGHTRRRIARARAGAQWRLAGRRALAHGAIPPINPKELSWAAACRGVMVAARQRGNRLRRGAFSTFRCRAELLGKTEGVELWGGG
jgi:hypothetical protein